MFNLVGADGKHKPRGFETVESLGDAGKQSRRVRDMGFVIGQKIGQQFGSAGFADSYAMRQKPALDQKSRAAADHRARLCEVDAGEPSRARITFKVETRSQAVSASVPSRSKTRSGEGRNCCIAKEISGKPIAVKVACPRLPSRLIASLAYKGAAIESALDRMGRAGIMGFLQNLPPRAGRIWRGSALAGDGSRRHGGEL